MRAESGQQIRWCGEPVAHAPGGDGDKRDADAGRSPAGAGPGASRRRDGRGETGQRLAVGVERPRGDQVDPLSQSGAGADQRTLEADGAHGSGCEGPGGKTGKLCPDHRTASGGTWRRGRTFINWTSWLDKRNLARTVTST